MKDRNAFNESQQYFSSDLKLVIALSHGVMKERERETAMVISITFLNFRAVRKRHNRYHNQHQILSPDWSTNM